MLELDQIKLELPKINNRFAEVEASINPPAVEARIDQLNEKVAEPGFWNDNQEAQKVLREKKGLETKLEAFSSLKAKLEDMDVMLELAESEGDMDMALELAEGVEEASVLVEDMLVRTLLDGEYDMNNAIISIHAGSGGTEAMDWAEMLLRMYTRWCERHGYKMELVDINDDTEAGIKSATFLVKGDNAYGYLKNERGVHRLVRISPFDASGRRHTSFASLDVTPEIDDDVDVEIRPEDIRIDTYRSSGAGGQHVNKTDSAIRITHLPTNIVVTCQNERSQHQNKEVAMKLLISKLIEIKEQENKENLDEIRGDYSQITWGSQIRSYVFQPYTMVKDHRTNAEVGNVEAVMDGDLDYLIREKLKQRD